MTHPENSEAGCVFVIKNQIYPDLYWGVTRIWGGGSYTACRVGRGKHSSMTHRRNPPLVDVTNESNMVEQASRLFACEAGIRCYDAEMAVIGSQARGFGAVRTPPQGRYAAAGGPVPPR